MNKKVLGIALTVFFLAMLVAPVMAKSYKVPEGVTLSYFSSGSAVIENTPVGTLQIHLADVVDSTDGPGDFIHIDLWWGSPEAGMFMPLAVIGTNPDRMALFETIWTGVPAMINNFVVSEDELQVDRHGNRITASLNIDISCFVLYPTPHYLDIPAFTMELNKVGGSFHREDSTLLDFYNFASGYTLEWDRMGFDANGALTCLGWSYDAQPMTDCLITKHGISTYTPPPPDYVPPMPS